jgi:hypothetical protein
MMIEAEEDTMTRIWWRQQRIVVCSGAAFEGAIKDDD